MFNRPFHLAFAVLSFAGLSYAQMTIPSGTKVACRLEQTIYPPQLRKRGNQFNYL